MSAQTVVIERIGRGAGAGDVRGLATLLLDAVDSNAGATPRGSRARCRCSPRGRRTSRIAQTSAKLIVHRRARRRGIARSLMEAVEREAVAAGFTLLLLDTCLGGAAEQLYASTGWVRVGAVPGFALNPDGSECDTVFYYKQLV